MPTQPAILGSARLGNFRLGYRPSALATARASRARVLVGGILANHSVKQGSVLIHDALNDAPNTASLTMTVGSSSAVTFQPDAFQPDAFQPDAFQSSVSVASSLSVTPIVDQDLRVTVNSDAPVLLFNGTIQSVDMSYEGRPTQLAWPCSAIDDIARLNRKRPFGTWTDVSATTIAQELVAGFAPGFTTTHVQAGLPTVSITFDGTEDLSACLARVAKAIGGYYYVEDLDLHLFTEEATDTPDPLEPGYPFLDDPPIRVNVDTSQRRTRVYGKGHGEALISDVGAGETILPIADAVMFPLAGGQAIVGTTPDGAQSQIVSYALAQTAEGGSLVGPGVSPSVGPTLNGTPGAGVESGVHGYAYTWVTAAGQTLPSPLTTITVGATTGPPPKPSAIAGDQFAQVFNNGVTQGATYRYVATYSLATSSSDHSLETAISAVSLSVVPVANTNYPGNTSALYCSVLVTSNPAVKWIHIYRTLANGSTFYLQHTSANPGSGSAGGYDIVSDATLSTHVTAPVADSSVTNRVAIAGVATGPTGTTSRNVYRTTAGGAQLKLLATIADNTTATYTDAIADASLGANALASDTSGLATIAGQINAGSTSILTASSGPFSTTGGWVRLSSGQVARYSGISGNTLTGVPAMGSGAILTTVQYGSPIVPAPALTGVSGVVLPMLKGAMVHIWVQRDDLAAQAALVAIDAAQGRVSDGVVEHTITDERRGEASLIALCDADLALFSRPLVTVAYATRDTKTKSGKPIIVNLVSPPISETLTIQSVDISEIDIAYGLAPRFSVVASNVRFSLEDLLRRMAVAVGA
jgi:hypothetical protein